MKITTSLFWTPLSDLTPVYCKNIKETYWPTCLQKWLWHVGQGREPWERNEAGGTRVHEGHLHATQFSSPMEELRKNKRRSDISGTRDRCGVQVTLINTCATDLTLFPRFSAPPTLSSVKKGLLIFPIIIIYNKMDYADVFFPSCIPCIYVWLWASVNLLILSQILYM